jgi:hypothetical protein
MLLFSLIYKERGQRHVKFQLKQLTSHMVEGSSKERDAYKIE